MNIKAIARSYAFATVIVILAVAPLVSLQRTATLIGRPTAFWSEHKQYVVGASAVLIAQLALVVGLLVQRTRRQRAERALSESEERYRIVVETQTELICRFLPDTTLTFVNDAYCRFWGKTSDESDRHKIPGAHSGRLLASLVERQIASLVETPHIDTLRARSDPGQWRNWLATMDESRGRGRGRSRPRAARRRTGRHRAQARRRGVTRTPDCPLNASYKRIHDLAGRLIAGQETERHRIARELHDDLSQKLALLTIDIEQLARGALMRITGVARRVRSISKRSAEIASDVHRLSHELHPTKLEALGLVAAVRTICRDVSHQHGIDVDFSHTRVPTAIPPQVALCFYRIVQEALHNVVKHSGAKQASVKLTGGDDALDLAIADPGLGFVPSTTGSTGLGLVSMRERVNFLGGRIAIHSAPGRGTRIGVRAPLERSRADTPARQQNPETSQLKISLAGRAAATRPVLFAPQRVGGIDAGRAPGRHIGREQRDREDR